MIRIHKCNETRLVLFEDQFFTGARMEMTKIDELLVAETSH
jgi:hypothetical protein